MKKISFREKFAKVDKLNQLYGFPVKGTKARVYIKYSQPKALEGAYSVVVSGFIRAENGDRFPFKGILIQQWGTETFKDINKNLTESLEKANEKAGNPLVNAYDYINEKISINAPFDAIDDYVKGIKVRKQKAPKEKPVKEPKEVVEKKVRQKELAPLSKDKFVEIDLYSLEEKEPQLYASLSEINPDIDEYPYGVVHDFNNDRATIIFKNEKYMVLPRRYLTPKKQQVPTAEKEMQDALSFYEQAKRDPEAIKHLSKGIIGAMIKYKKSRNIPLDEIDKQLEMATFSPTSWIKNIFKGK